MYKDYYKTNGIIPQKSVEEQQSIVYYQYEGIGQTISLMVMDNKPALIALNQYEPDTERIIVNAFYQKETFGLPVFMITIMEDTLEAMLNIMNHELYVSLDTLQE